MKGYLQISWDASLDYFGLDKLYNIVAPGTTAECPQPASHGAGIITDEESYEAILPCLYRDKTIEALLQSARDLKDRHDRGEIIIRLWLDGYFWFPRVLLGIERHLFAFYDQPELLHRINHDLAEFNMRVVEALFPYPQAGYGWLCGRPVLQPWPDAFHEAVREFLTPYYQRLSRTLRNYGVKVLVDSDGDISSMVSWFEEAGIEGVYPLERQAGVELAKIRRRTPAFSDDGRVR